MGTEIVGRNNVFDLDISKLVISTRGTNLTGKYVYDYLRTKSHVQLEMASIDYCIAMTSPLDSQDGIMSLFTGLVELDSQASRESLSKKNIYEIQNIDNRVSIYEAMSSAKQKVSIKNTLGSVSSEYVMAYPPGIPIIAPGEIITANHLELIERYKEAGITVIGPEDESIQYLNVMVNPKEGLGEKSLSHKIFCIMGKSLLLFYGRNSIRLHRRLYGKTGSLCWLGKSITRLSPYGVRFGYLCILCIRQVLFSNIFKIRFG